MNLRGCPGRDEPALIGVSGGRDSVALLHALVEAGHRQLIVCHLDHALRAESADDAKFVAQLTKRMKLPVVVARENVAALAKRKRLSLETAAREARYAFFARAARQHRCHDLLIAHHADDQAETFLFNLLRGSGSAGLSAMLAHSTRKIGRITLAIHRPLLGVWRSQIDAYIAAHKLAFREDASNADPKHTRNRVRAEILPMLEGLFGRDVRRALWRAAEILRAEDELLESLTPRESSADELSQAMLRALPLALQRRTIHTWLRAHGIANVGFDEVERVRSMIETESRAKVNLPENFHARRRAGVIFIERPPGLSH